MLVPLPLLLFLSSLFVLGTNDTCQTEKRRNWGHHPDLQKDALALISEFQKVNPNVIVPLCSPPPMLPNKDGLKPARKANLLERHDSQLADSNAKAALVLPHTATERQPWIWRARFFGHEPAPDLHPVAPLLHFLLEANRIEKPGHR